jgi:hypothetical protein
LDSLGADRLFDLAKITITDMIEDLRARGLTKPELVVDDQGTGESA